MGLPAVLRVDIVSDAKGVGRGVDDATSRFGKLGSAARTAGRVAGAGLALAGVAAGKFALDSIKSASNVQQAFGALDTVYGKSADKVKRWAEGAADSVGLASSEYANLASLVGAQLQGMGVETDKSAGKTKDLIKMGADLAATYGGSVSEAVGAVSSLLKGEADPIERYGVSIKAADVSARLAAQGLGELTGKAEKQARAQATLELLTKQTTKAQGAFSRESNTLAGQQERLRAKFENIKATVGQKLLPVVTRLTTWASEKALPGLSKLGSYLAARLGPAFKIVGSFISDRAIPAIRDIYTWFVTKLAPGIKRAVSPILAGLVKAFGSVRDSIDRNRPAIDKILSAFRTVAEFIANRVAPVVGKIAGKAFETLGKVIGTTVDVISTLVDWISRAIDGVERLIGWISRIDIPDIDIPGFGRTVAGGTVPMTSTTGTLDGTKAGAYGVTPTVVNIEVKGALDPVAVAKQIREILRDDVSRRGGRISLGGVV
jgi:hypothetical protein